MSYEIENLNEFWAIRNYISKILCKCDTVEEKKQYILLTKYAISKGNFCLFQVMEAYGCPVIGELKFNQIVLEEIKKLPSGEVPIEWSQRLNYLLTRKDYQNIVNNLTNDLNRKVIILLLASISDKTAKNHIKKLPRDIIMMLWNFLRY